MNIKAEITELIKDAVFRLYCYDDADQDASEGIDYLAEEILEVCPNHFRNLVSKGENI